MKYIDSGFYHTPALTMTSAECIDEPLSLRISSCMQFKGIINTHGQHNTALILTEHSSRHRRNKTPTPTVYCTYKHGMHKHGTHTGYVRCSCQTYNRLMLLVSLVYKRSSSFTHILFCFYVTLTFVGLVKLKNRHSTWRFREKHQINYSSFRL